MGLKPLAKLAQSLRVQAVTFYPGPITFIYDFSDTKRDTGIIPNIANCAAAGNTNRPDRAIHFFGRHGLPFEIATGVVVIHQIGRFGLRRTALDAVAVIHHEITGRIFGIGLDVIHSIFYFPNC
jgi:hypothetical protein